MEPTTHASAGAFRLNGIIWFSIVLLFLSAFISRSSTALLYVLVITGVAGIGVLANLGLCLWQYATDRPKAALSYLICTIPLAILLCWLWYGLQHIGKMSG